MKIRMSRVLGVALAWTLCATGSRAEEKTVPAVDAPDRQAPVALAEPVPAAGGAAAPAPMPAVAGKQPDLFKRVDLGGARDQPTVITSTRIEFDYKEMVAVFDENVRVANPQFLLLADRVLVFLEGTNEIKQIMAIGRVSVTNELRSASCDKAVYTRAAEQLVLTGNARLLRGGDSVSGDRIDIWLNDERMEVTPGTVVFKPATVKNNPDPVKPDQP
jgi:lipopolysaccharide transport protein LptA